MPFGPRRRELTALSRAAFLKQTAIALSWKSPVMNSTGGSPITGYKVYMFPGVPLITAADPEPVKKEIQQITTYVAAPATEVQKIEPRAKAPQTYSATSDAARDEADGASGALLGVGLAVVAIVAQQLLSASSGGGGGGLVGFPTI